ncbi:hypothetical protein EDC01DRAFT_123678 [Geopyxis carbonaria]|nr:hypothetical protein EDC01DRAFT_123678 [Geopyxis carbonaria]
MVTLHRTSSLDLVLDTPKGRGIFARSPLPAGTIIDTAPVILLSDEDFEAHVRHSALWHYSYNWPTTDPATGKPRTQQALVLGLGSMFNHSTRAQNVGWKRDVAAQCVVYVALRDIAAGEELLISYGARLTFVDVDEEREREREKEEEGDPLAGIDIDL